MSDIGFDNIDWNQLGNPDYLIRLGVDPTVANTLPQGGPPQPTTVGGLAQNALSGRAIVTTILRDAGLNITPELDQYITNLTTNFGSDLSRLGAVVNADLYDTGSTLGKVVDQAYPELQRRIKNGYAPITVAEAISYRTTAQQYARANGLPPDLLDPGALIANNVSLPEVQSRLTGFYADFQASAPDVVQKFHDDYGFTPEQVGALAVNPDVTEQHLIRMFQSAQLGAVAARTGFGSLGPADTEQLAAQGVTPDQAQQGFGQLTSEQPLFAPLPGQEATEDVIGTDTQLAAQFGNSAAARLRIQRRQQARAAQLASSSGFTPGAKGVVGLGSAESA